MIRNMITAMDQWALKDPERLAYDDLGRTNTYGELKQWSDALAARLDQMDLPTGAPIMVYGGQKFEMMATFLGIVKSGHAYVPIDTPMSQSTRIRRWNASLQLTKLPNRPQQLRSVSCPLLWEQRR